MIQTEQAAPSRDEDIIKELCSCNGISYEKISQEANGVEALEAFFSGFPRMVGLSLFPRLIRLTIVGQDIREIQGLEECSLLQELWVAECHLNKISGLQSCLQLQKLFLYDNKISEIGGLDTLINLDVLWLNNNHISKIKGLNRLGNLKELNLADNVIETIGNGLEQNHNLEHLNLSGNIISSFKELTQLTRLKKLRKLGLNDPQSCPNPVCMLCNYSTHVLYHIPTLHWLDSYDVSLKLMKDAAECTVKKKMMYYNMRVHCIQRHFNETKEKLRQLKKEKQQLPEEKIRLLSYTLKHLEKSEAANGKTSYLLTNKDMSTEFECGSKEDLEKKKQSIIESRKRWEQQLEEAEVCFQENVARASDRKEMLVLFLNMELETVGNIRFEEGNSCDTWFDTCYNLLLSRFCALDFKPHITGIKINSIFRVHNRGLHLRFEDKLHALLVNKETPSLIRNYRQSLEHLFYVSDAERSSEGNEIMDILENGFKSSESYLSLGRQGAVPLSNSLYFCEEALIQSPQKKNMNKGASGSIDHVPFENSQLIICKVFLGHSVPLRDGVPVDSELYPNAHSVYHKASNDQQPDKTGEKNGQCSCRQWHTHWYVFHHELVLPEYLINFEYITQKGHDPLCDPEHGHAPPDVPSVLHEDPILDEQVLALQPVLKHSPKLLSLDDKDILTMAQANILSQITVLNLHGNGLSSLKEISHLSALRHLTISFNELTYLNDISHMTSLEFVDASFNQITSLSGFQGLSRLKQLNLCWNQLSRVRDDAAVLHEQAPSLQQLDTRHNPWSQDQFFWMILGQLKTLTHLDGVLITDELIADLAHVKTEISTKSLLLHSRTDSIQPRCLSLLSMAQLLTQLKPSPWSSIDSVEPGWKTKITVLNLDAQHLCCISNLEELVNLRWASFNENQLTHIQGLEHCTLLEELSFDHNLISSLEGVCTLQNLTRLSINNNQLQGLDGSVLECLPNLHFLSAENNCISSLRGVQKSHCIFELYLGNNDISGSRDIYRLKSLNNLIILDLYGNPLVRRLENYRAYAIFHLTTLKALDGIPVDMSETESAKDIFGGRLTADIVTENLGHTNYRELVELDMPACSIRIVDLAPPDLFENLHSVNLEHNNLTSFGSLIYLPKVKVLFLNHNHIQTILPQHKTQSHLNGRQQLYQKVHSSGYGQQSRTNREYVNEESLEPLLSSLEVLHIGYNGISNLFALQLSRLTNLRALFLQGNEIVQLEGLERLYLLHELNLDQNRVKTLCESWLSAQKHLIELCLNDNRLCSLTYLSLPSLQRLFLNNNKLLDVAELDKLETLPSLTQLSVVGNPVTRRSHYRASVLMHLTQLLVLDEVRITLEERTQAELFCAEFPGYDVSFSGLLCSPIVRADVPSTGLQNLQIPECVIGNSSEETPRKHKKQRAGVTSSRSASCDKQRGAQITGHRAGVTNTDSDYRYPSGCKPPVLKE